MGVGRPPTLPPREGRPGLDRLPRVHGGRLLHGAQSGQECRLQRYQWLPDGVTGNIAKIGDNDYLYDVLSRITQADMDSSDQQSYTYDDFGNMTSITTNSVTRSISVDSSTNHLTGSGIQYDAAGNQLNQVDGPANLSFSYDAFNQIKGVQDSGLDTDVVYIYTVNEDRLMTVDLENEVATTTVRGFGRKVLRVFESDFLGNWSLEKDYIYGGGALIASESAADGQRFYLSDHLGTIRRVKNSTGTTVATHDYLPFGEEIGGPSGSEAMQYTGHERDSLGAGVEDDLDYMHHRFYGSRIGRFVAIDPARESAFLGAPQTLNRYTYVYNNPLSYRDPDGRVPILLPALPWIITGIEAAIATMVAIKIAEEVSDHPVLEGDMTTGWRFRWPKNEKKAKKSSGSRKSPGGGNGPGNGKSWFIRFGVGTSLLALYHGENPLTQLKEWKDEVWSTIFHYWNPYGSLYHDGFDDWGSKEVVSVENQIFSDIDNPLDPAQYVGTVMRGATAGTNLMNELCEDAIGCDPDDLGTEN